MSRQAYQDQQGQFGGNANFQKQQDYQENPVRFTGSQNQQTIPKNNNLGGARANQGQTTGNFANQEPNYQGNYEYAQVDQQNGILRSRIRELEDQLHRSNQENDNLYNRLTLTENELSRTKEILLKMGDTAGWKGAQVNDLNNRYHELASGHNQFLENARSHTFTVQRELEHKDNEIKRLKNLLDERNDKLKVVTVTQEKNFDRCLILDKEIQNLQDENQKLRRELQQKSHELDMSKLSHKAEGTFMVEVEHLRGDVQRLLDMLRNTEEYKEFADIADDSTHSIRYLKDIKARTYVDAKCHTHCKFIRPCQCPKTGENQWVEDEKLLWVPEEAFRFAHEFRLKYNGELTDTLIEQLLFELNKIWSKREQRLLKRVKGSAASETASLRRQLAFNPTYDEHQAKITIQRLQNQLKQAYKENREAFAQRERRNPPGTHYVNETLKINKELHKSKKRSEQQNDVLKKKVANMELHKYGDHAQKAIFMEGAQWMSNKILSEIDGLQLNINNHAKQFHEKQEQLILNNEKDASSSFGPGQLSQPDPNLILRKCDWFLENVDQDIFTFKSKVQQLNRHSEKDMVDANQAVKTIQKSKTAIIGTF
ncbi:hypothetical protein ABPG72_007564 [Tetrahymena utriculariae]